MEGPKVGADDTAMTVPIAEPMEVATARAFRANPQRT